MSDWRYNREKWPATSGGLPVHAVVQKKISLVPEGRKIIPDLRRSRGSTLRSDRKIKKRKPAMELEGKRVGIFVENRYQEFEFWYPYFRMKEAGAKVSIIGTGAKEYTSLLGVPAPGVSSRNCRRPQGARGMAYQRICGDFRSHG